MKPADKMTYLLSTAGESALRCFVDRDTLFAFDLDGTLAPIVADPSRIMIPDVIREKMGRLCCLANVAILTGRARNDARTYLGFEPRFIVGNHGAEGLPGWEKREEEFIRQCRAWEEQFRSILPQATECDIFIENKGATLSLHYRNSPEREVAHREILRAIKRLEPLPRRISGKCVENIMPEDAPHKGEALQLIMRHAGSSRAVFVGDDLTDEDVFRLKSDHILGVRIGCEASSAADYCLSEQKEIITLLDEIIRLNRTTHRKAQSETTP